MNSISDPLKLQKSVSLRKFRQYYLLPLGEGVFRISTTGHGPRGDRLSAIDGLEATWDFTSEEGMDDGGGGCPSETRERKFWDPKGIVDYDFIFFHYYSRQLLKHTGHCSCPLL